jgi:hypothetical protein
MAVTPDGYRILLTGGGFQDELTDGDMQTVALERGEGHLVWRGWYNGPDNLWDRGKENVVSADGSVVYALGSSEGATTGDDFAIVAHDVGTGAVLWSARYDGAAHQDDVAVAIDVSRVTGEVFATGMVVTQSGLSDIATLAYASDGSPLWVEQYGDATESEDVWGLAANPASAAVYVTGRDNRPYSWVYVTIAYGG